MKQVIKFVALLLIPLVILSFSENNVHAKEKKEISSQPTEGIPSKNPNKGEGNIGPLKVQENQYLMDGQSSISAKGSTVTVSGNTQAFSQVDTIVVDLYLQRWDANQGTWVDAVHVGEFRDYYTNTVSGGKDVIVVPGYYYRTKSHHWVVESGIRENGYSYSSYIYVD